VTIAQEAPSGVAYGVSLGTVALRVDIARVARLVEDYGFESLFAPDHTHVPVSHATLYPEDAGWTTTAAQLLDPFILLALVAAHTQRLRMGTGVCVIPQRDPILLAREVASLDHVSGGRFLFGIGAGWARPELENHGVSFRERWQIASETLAAAKEIWGSETAVFTGTYVRFSPLWQWPKPVTQPHPPILVGGHTRAAIELALEAGHVWYPHAGELFSRSYPVFRGLGGSSMSIYNAPRQKRQLHDLISRGATRLVFSLNDLDHPEPQPERLAQARI
jgi:probable F420-dependent oxidoreductase